MKSEHEAPIDGYDRSLGDGLYKEEDLTPVRARIVEDPKEYRWSGYGQAVAGRKEAISGLAVIAQFFGMERREEERGDFMGLQLAAIAGCMK